MLGYGFLLYILPLTYIHPLWNPCQDTSEYFGDLSKNDTTNILNSYILLKNSLSQSEAIKLSETRALLSFNSPSKSGSALFGMRSQPILVATQPLAQDWRLWVAKNNFLWVIPTHRESYELWGSFRNLCESPKGLSDDLQWSLMFPLFL